MSGCCRFGHAAFFGMAGYVAGLRGQGLGPAAGARSSSAAPSPARLLGVVVGWIAIRRQGIYFAMITLALAQMVYFFCAPGALHRRRGRHPGRAARQASSASSTLDRRHDDVLRWSLAIFLAGFLLIHRIIHSPFGQVLKAIRENEPRAISLGYDVDRYKLMAFVLSAALAGLAGATKSLVFGIATLTDVHWSMSGEVVLMTLVGGLGTVFGPVVGASVIVDLQNYLAQIGAWVTVIQGAIFVALRAGLPARARRRAWGAAERQALGAEPGQRSG